MINLTVRNYCRKVYVLYGSQTGNSETIGKDLADKLQEDNIETECLPLNSAKKLVLKDLAKILIIICATTGNGDAPENADAWWRSTKLRSAVSVHFLSFINCINY